MQACSAGVQSRRSSKSRWLPTIAGDSATLHIFTLWGGVDLRVPEDWNVVVRGVPVLGTTRNIKDAAIRAIEQGQTKYTEVGGVPELRAAVCQKLKRDHGLEYAPDEVTVSCGAKHTLYNIVMSLVNPGDEVVIPSPFWVSYPEQVLLLGGVPVAATPEQARRMNDLVDGFDFKKVSFDGANESRLKTNGGSIRLAPDQAPRPQQPGQSDGRGVLRGRSPRGRRARGGARPVDHLRRML